MPEFRTADRTISAVKRNGVDDSKQRVTEGKTTGDEPVDPVRAPP